MIALSVALSKVLDAMEDLAPKRTALEGDRIGLQTACSPQIDKALLTLDVDVRVLKEAKRRKAELIIAHHPVIYRKLESLTDSSFAERVVAAAIKDGIGIFVAHTNLDCAPDGVNDVLAQRLELSDIRPLKLSHEEKCYKVVVFVPEDHVDKVRAAMCEAGAGRIGAYKYCSFQSPGTGTFLPLEDATPFSGAIGQLNKEPELRLEVLVPDNKMNDTIGAMKLAHPYEEVAYDIYKLENPCGIYGMGRIGDLPDAVHFKDYVELVKRRLGIKRVRFVGRGRSRIKHVACCGGSGGDLLPEVLSSGADAYVTGEMNYHNALEADSAGLCVVEAGHGATERIVLPVLAENLQRKMPDLKISLSRIKTNRSDWI